MRGKLQGKPMSPPNATARKAVLNTADRAATRMSQPQAHPFIVEPKRIGEEGRHWAAVLATNPHPIRCAPRFARKLRRLLAHRRHWSSMGMTLCHAWAGPVPSLGTVGDGGEVVVECDRRWLNEFRLCAPQASQAASETTSSTPHGRRHARSPLGLSSLLRQACRC